MIMRSVLIAVILTMFSSLAFAQETARYTEINKAYKKGNKFFEKSLYGQAQKNYARVLEMTRQVSQPEWMEIKMRSELNFARAAVRLEQEKSEMLILDFVKAYAPDPIANEAILEAATYYYNQKEYKKAIEFYAMVDVNNLPKAEQKDVLFKNGYSLFVRQKWAAARTYFSRMADERDVYYYPSNYYLGLTHFYLEDYAKALRNLKNAEQSKNYNNHIPYYVAQIYFAEKKYDEVIAYANPLLSEPSVKKKRELTLLIGQSYFEKQDYAAALPYLERYAEITEKLSKETFYQIGFLQYKSGNYAKAVENFKEVSTVKSELGQNAYFLLGDCHVKLGEKNNARNAFAAAGRQDFNPSTQQDANWNYAKLSYEMKYDTEAIDIFQKVGAEDKRYLEAQDYLSKMFLNTRDYTKALAVLEKINNRTNRMEETYQKVTYSRGIELYNAGKVEAAVEFFDKSLEANADPQTKALANYRLGDIAHKNGELAKSEQYLSAFLNSPNSASMPEDATVHTANYTQGYNYLKRGNYTQALSHFKKAISGIEINKANIKSTYIKDQVLNDAKLKAGDSAFKLNDYTTALRYYDDVINSNDKPNPYALFQKANVRGLQGSSIEKFQLMALIVSDFPESEYADDALYAIGKAYIQAGTLSDAEAPLQQLLKEYPNSTLYNAALLKLGLSKYNQESYPEAINYYKEVFKHNPDKVEADQALLALEEIYIQDLGSPKEYVKFRKSIPGYKMDNAEQEALSFRAAKNAYANAQYDRAIPAMISYLEDYPNGAYSIEAIYVLGESKVVQKEYAQAMQYYQKVIDKGNSKFYEKALGKAALIAYNFDQNFVKSYQLYSKIESIASTENKLEAQLNALRSAYKINNTDGVYFMASKIEINPLASPDQKSVAAFYQGKIGYEKKDYNKALENFNKALRNIKEGEIAAESRYLIAEIYFTQNEVDIAKGIVMKAHKESAGQEFWIAKSIILLSDILSKQGDLLNAKAALEAVTESYTESQELVSIANKKLIALNTKIEAESRINAAPSNGDLPMDGGQ